MISKQLLFPVISFDFTKKRKLSSISTFWGIGHIHKQVAGDATGGVEKSGRRRRGLWRRAAARDECIRVCRLVAALARQPRHGQRSTRRR